MRNAELLDVAGLAYGIGASKSGCIGGGYYDYYTQIASDSFKRRKEMRAFRLE